MHLRPAALPRIPAVKKLTDFQAYSHAALGSAGGDAAGMGAGVGAGGRG